MEPFAATQANSPWPGVRLPVVTIEMPFKDHDDNPDPRTDWNGKRSMQSGKDVLSVMAAMVGGLR